MNIRKHLSQKLGLIYNVLLAITGTFHVPTSQNSTDMKMSEKEVILSYSISKKERTEMTLWEKRFGVVFCTLGFYNLALTSTTTLKIMVRNESN